MALPRPATGPEPSDDRVAYDCYEMTKAELHRLVDALPDEVVDGAGLLLERVLSSQLDVTQAWVWTADWQDQLRESLADLAAGRTQRFDSDDDFVASL